jgi:predicted nucleic acid-binding protein
MNLFDTGVVIDMIHEKKFSPGVISSTTIIEVLRGFEDKKRQKVRELLEESFQLLGLDDNIIETYRIIYRQFKKDDIPLPDADLIIASSAFAQDLTLETNDPHFQRLKTMGLKLK